MLVRSWNQIQGLHLQQLCCMRYDQNILCMSLHTATIRQLKCQTITLNFHDHTRWRKRFSPWSPPPNRFCPGISKHDAITRVVRGILAEAVGKLCARL